MPYSLRSGMDLTLFYSHLEVSATKELRVGVKSLSI
jgi:hypothetical protein